MIMPSSATFKVFSALVLALILGLFFGYLIGASTESKTITFNDCPASATIDNPAKIITRKKIKTNLTAKEAADTVLQEALSWAEDSYIAEIILSSKQINAEGEANGWKIVYYSKEKNKLYEILIKDSESRGGEEKTLEGKNTQQTLKGEMIDSTILVKSFFGQNPKDTEITSLKMYYEPNSKKFLWTIFFPKGSYTINAEI